MRQVDRFHLSYLPPFDGLRAVAVLAVMAFHFNVPGVHGGFLGVDVFFVLSGFLITALLFDEWDRSGRIAFGRFYMRRALRLLPAVVVLVLVYSLFLWARGGFEWRIMWPTLAYVANWISAYGLWSLEGLRHTWSLSVEEQFYFIWPVLALLLLRGLRTHSARLWTVVVGIVALVIWRAGLQLDGAPVARLYNGLDTRADALLVGCSLAIGLKQVGLEPFRRRRGALALVASVSALFLGGMFFVADHEWPALYYGGATLIAVATVAVVAWIIAYPDSLSGRVLAKRPLVHIGRLSYAIYLWHWPVMLYLDIDRHVGRYGEGALRIVLTFVLAEASYFLVERPFLALKPRFGGLGAVAPATEGAPEALDGARLREPA